MIKFPYGISDFYTIRRHDYLYIDRTHYIAELEDAGRQLVFLRPRRFGKSLWLSVLANYYDINQRDEFESLFADLHVGKHPTPEWCQYLILRWDFSKISAQGDINKITANLFDHINNSIEDFSLRYQHHLKTTIPIKPDNALASFDSLCNAVAHSKQQLYLFIDEYDNMANEILIHKSEGKKRYKDLLSGEGVFKTLFKNIKANASKSQIARVFITGVSPLVLSDLTSGYNVAIPISQESRFNALCGLDKTELSEIAQHVLEACNKPELLDETLETMRQFYNGYRFAHDMSKALVYNPTLCFYFLRHYQLECSPPSEMLDANLAMDAERIRYIAHLPAGARVIEKILDEQNPVSLRKLEIQFGVEKLQEMREQDPYLLSFLYYFGVLTITGEANLGKMQLGSPNLVVQALYIEQLKTKALTKSQDKQYIQELAEDFYQTANLEPLVTFLETQYLTVFNNRDYKWSNELTIKTAFLTLLFDDSYYIMDSESSLKRRYSDLLMIIRPNMRQHETLKDFVLEFKYIKLKTLGLSGEAVREQSHEDLAQLPLVQTELNNAFKQLRDYRDVLNAKYQEPERMVCIAVVALGFDRLVWRVLEAS